MSTKSRSRASTGPTTDNDDLRQKWLRWHSGVEASELDRLFGEWRSLRERHSTLRALVDRLKSERIPLLNEVLHELDQASRHLSFEVPYRIVVLGESGLGKSALVNALFGIDLLPSEPGGVITGVATRIVLVEDEQSEHVRVIHRTDEEFVRLLAGMSKRFDLELQGRSVDDLLNALDGLDEELFRRPVPEPLRGKIIHDLRDIAKTWKLLNEQNRVGAVEMYPIDDRATIEGIIKENSRDGSATGTSRTVAGIESVVFALHQSTTSEERSWAAGQIEVVDAPGFGASTLRHTEVLQHEVESADAVLLVLSSMRPEGKTSIETAQLLQEVFFTGLSAEQTSDLAAKLFLIANRYDDVLRTDNRHEALANLQRSMESVASLIAPDFWRRYCRDGATERHYFQTIAQLAVLAQSKRTRELSQDEQTAFNSFVALFKGEAGAPGRMLDVSGIPQVRTALRHFLTHRRVTLSLQEAGIRIDNAELKLTRAAKTLLAAAGVDFQEGLTPDAARSDYELAHCDRVLDETERELVAATERMIGSLDMWRTEDGHPNALKATVNGIFSSLKFNLQLELDRQIPLLVSQTRVDHNGRRITEGLPKTLATTVERRLRELIVLSSESLATYYIDQLDRALAVQDLMGMLDRASYEQVYANDFHLDPRRKAMTAKMDLDREFESICRWSLLYELMRRPILIGNTSPESITRIWDVLKDITPEITASSLKALMAATGMSHWAAEIVASISRDLVEYYREVSLDLDTPSPTIASAQSSNPSVLEVTPTLTDPIASVSNFEHQANTDAAVAEWTPVSVAVAAEAVSEPHHLKSSEKSEVELVARILDYLNDGRVDKASNELQTQFALRYRASIAAALPIIEQLFFYEVSRFARVYRAIVRDLIRFHRSHVVADSQSQIRGVLLSEGTAQRQVVIDAVEILRAIDGG